MGMPRKSYVKEGEVGVYHCISRCVRRGFLCGFDALTGRDFSHRKMWIVDRLRCLVSIFAVEVLAYAIMETHNHNVLRTRPDLVTNWSDFEVATRWLTLFPRHRDKKRRPIPATTEEISLLAAQTGRIAELRKRLSSVSWFMGRLNEFIAREANREDKVKGRFWEGRFKCQVLLDEAAIASCMVYVDLNPIRAGLAKTPEDSDFTSIQERIRIWRKERSTMQGIPSAESEAAVSGQFPGSWLCPIDSESERCGILGMTALEYFDLVDKSGRIARPNKRGAIEADLAPILLRIGVNPDAWFETVSSFGSRFRIAAGLAKNLRAFANRLGQRWLQGLAMARVAFVS